MTTSNPPTAAQPIDLDKPGFEVFAREACNMPEGIALNWDAAWTKAAYEGWCGALARQQPVARVDRIISASGLAEVSVFLESALKVGTVFYAAPVHAAEPAAPHAGGIVKEAILMGAHAEFSEAMPPLSLTSLGHRNVFKALRKAIQFYINHAAAPAAPHAQAEPVYQMRSLTEPGGWLDTDADGPTSIKRMPHWASVYEFRTLYTAPVPQEAEQAATTAVMDAIQGETAAQVGAGDLPPYEVVAAVNSLRWMLNKSDECDKPNMRATTLLDKHHSKDGKTIRQDLEILWRYFDANRPEMTALLLSGADRAAAPAVTDATGDLTHGWTDWPDGTGIGGYYWTKEGKGSPIVLVHISNAKEGHALQVWSRPGIDRFYFDFKGTRLFKGVAAPAVTDAARDVLADAKGGA